MLTWTVLVTFLVLGIGCHTHETEEDDDVIQGKLHGLTEEEFHNLQFIEDETEPPVFSDDETEPNLNDYKRTNFTLSDDLLTLQKIMLKFAESTKRDFGGLFREGWTSEYVGQIDNKVDALGSIIYAFKQGGKLKETITSNSKQLIEQLSFAVGNGYMEKYVVPHFRNAYKNQLLNGPAPTNHFENWGIAVREGLMHLNSFNAYSLENGQELRSLQDEIESIRYYDTMEELKHRADPVYRKCISIHITLMNDKIRKEMFNAIAQSLSTESREEFQKFQSWIFDGTFFNPDMILNDYMWWTDGVDPETVDRDELALKKLFGPGLVTVPNPDTVFIPVSSLPRLL